MSWIDCIIAARARTGTPRRRRRAAPSGRAARSRARASMRPCSSSMSCASRDSTWTRLKRARWRSFSAASSSRNITVRRRAVAVEQREVRSRLGVERGLDDRQDRRDAAAGRERDVVARAPARSSGTLKCPIGGITSSVSPGFEPLVGPGREHAARRALDRDAQPRRPARPSRSSTSAARPGRRWPRAASGAGPARSGTARASASGTRERDDDRVARLALDARDRQRMEAAHRASGLVRLEVVERLAAVVAAVQRLARGRAELRDQRVRADPQRGHGDVARRGAAG